MKIESPADISELVDSITTKGFEQLDSWIVNVVIDTENDMFFHRDKIYTYSFDNSALQNGAIYGMKERRVSCSDITTKVTADKLLLIQ